MKNRVVVLICSAIILLLAVYLASWQISRVPDNPYNNILANLSSSNVERISLVGRNPIRDIELPNSEQAELIALLSQVELDTADDPAWNTLIGGPRYYPFRIKLTDGTDFIFAVSELYFVIWPEAKAYYYTSVPERVEGPSGYPMDVYNEPDYEDLLDLANHLFEQFFSE